MSQLIAGIWQNAPVWVWPLFFVLLAIGIFSMRDRNSSVIPYYFYPLFGLSAIGAISGLQHVPLNWIVFALGYTLGLAAAFRWQNRLVLEKKDRQLRIKGERITILILMVIFCSNFVNGVIEAVAPDLRLAPLFTIGFGMVIGACSGSFTGRALRVLTLGNR